MCKENMKICSWQRISVFLLHQTDFIDLIKFHKALKCWLSSWTGMYAYPNKYNTFILWEMPLEIISKLGLIDIK